MRAPAVALALAALLALPLVPLASPAPGPSVTHLWIEGFDHARLRATWFVPEGDGPFPVVLRTHGWALTRDTEPTGFVGLLLERGYAVLTWDSRGFGESEGTVYLDSPDYEVKDVIALVDWVAERPEAQLDGPGNPRLGMTGGSYAGGIQLLAGVADMRIDAIAPEVAWNDLRQSLAPNGVLKLGWATLLYAAGEEAGYLGSPTSPTPNAEGVDPALTQWYGESVALGVLSPNAEPELAYRSISRQAARAMCYPHTLLVQGWKDTLFPPNEAVATFELLQRLEFDVRLMVHGGGHGWPTPDRARVDLEVLDFLDYWLKDTVAPVPPSIIAWQPWDQRWAQPGEWPVASEVLQLGAEAVGGAALPGTGYLAPRATGGVLALAASPIPLSLTEVPNFQPDNPLPATDAPGASALFAGPLLTAPKHVLGTPRIRVAVQGPQADATLFAKVVDIAGDGSYVVVGNQVTPMRVSGTGTDLAAEVDLAAIAHRFAQGHRVGLVLTTSDLGFASSRSPQPVLVRADGGSWLALPG